MAAGAMEPCAVSGYADLVEADLKFPCVSGQLMTRWERESPP